MAHSTSQKKTVVDQVLRYPESGIKVLVVGAGPSGLIAAIECWRKGHDVEIVEKGPDISPIGDIIALGPSAVAVIRHYPNLLQDYNDVGIDAEMALYHVDGTPAARPMEFEPNREGVAPHAAFPIRVSGIIGRYDITDILYQQCVRLGIHIKWNKPITEYRETDTKKALAITADGTSFEADLVLAADGLGSRSHSITLGRNVRAVGTGYSIYRAAMLTKDIDLRNTPLIKQFLEKGGRPQCRMYAGHNQHTLFVVSQRLISISLTLPNTEQGKESESWSSTIPASTLIASLPPVQYDPMFLEALKALPSGVVKWDICVRDPQLRWTSDNGRVLQIGDSAHSFVPTSGSGATVAMEDGPSIAECVRLAGKANVGTATKVHELLRSERVSLIQLMGLVNRSNFHHEDPDAVKQLHNRLLLGKWLWGHQSEEYARENYRKAAAHLSHRNEPFGNTNVPPGYVHQPWTLKEQLEREKEGVIIDLRQNGDWSTI